MEKKNGTNKGYVGLGAVIILLLGAVLFIQGIHISTSTVTNNSTTFLTTEGNFHTWSLVYNITAGVHGDQLVYITDAAVVETTGSNVTFVSLVNGGRLANWQLTYPTGQFDPTSTINYVYNVYLNSTAGGEQMIVLGHDGSLLQSTRLASGSCTVQQAVIAPTGLYIATKTGCPAGVFYMQLFKGS